MIRILVADDHEVVREGLKRIIASNSDMDVTGEAVDGNEVLDKVRKGTFDVIVLDISMPKCNGIDVLKQLKRENTKIHVLVLSVHPEDQYAVRVLKAGACGYLTKESAATELVTAIRRVYDGRKYITPSMAERLASGLTVDRDVPVHELLSDREFQVLKMMGSGNTVSDIAGELSLSVKTVSTYRTRILEKLSMKNTAEIIQYAVREGLVS